MSNQNNNQQGNQKKQGQQGQQSPARDRDPHKAITQPVNTPEQPNRRDDRADNQNPPQKSRGNQQQVNQGPGKQRADQDGFNRNPNRRDEESSDMPNDDDELKVERQERERH